jgi:hypothetical protein
MRLLGDTAGLYSLMIIFAVGSRYAESPESEEELSLLGDTIVREALNHAAETRDIDNVDFLSKLINDYSCGR